MIQFFFLRRQDKLTLFLLGKTFAIMKIKPAGVLFWGWGEVNKCFLKIKILVFFYSKILLRDAALENQKFKIPVSISKQPHTASSLDRL